MSVLGGGAFRVYVRLDRGVSHARLEGQTVEFTLDQHTANVLAERLALSAPRCMANGCGRLRGDGGPVCGDRCFQVRR